VGEAAAGAARASDWARESGKRRRTGVDDEEVGAVRVALANAR
jgi:hypothetical protein